MLVHQRVSEIALLRHSAGVAIRQGLTLEVQLCDAIAPACHCWRARVPQSPHFQSPGPMAQLSYWQQALPLSNWLQKNNNNHNIQWKYSAMFFNVLHVVSCGLHLPGEHPVSQRSSAQRAKAQPSVDQTNYVSIHTAIASRYVSMNHITSFQEIHLSVPNTTSKTSNEVLPVSSTGSGHKKRNIVDMSRHRKAFFPQISTANLWKIYRYLWWSARWSMVIYGDSARLPWWRHDFRRATASRSWLT